MTPIEIFEYKQRWMSSGYNHPVTYHSDYRGRAVNWCKAQLHKSKWNQKIFTDVYEDTVFFELEQDAFKFSNHMKKLEQRS